MILQQQEKKIQKLEERLSYVTIQKKQSLEKLEQIKAFEERQKQEKEQKKSKKKDRRYERQDWHRNVPEKF